MDHLVPQIDLLSDEQLDWELLETVASELQVPLRIYQSLASYPVGTETRSWIVSKVKLPDGCGCGCDLMERLRHASRVVPVIFLRNAEPVTDLVQIMKWGSQMILQKPLSAPEMLSVVRNVIPEMEGRGELVEATLDAHRKLATLDTEEQMVLDAATLGLPNKTAAMRMGVALRTLERRRYLLMKKLGVSSPEELVVLAIRKQYASWLLPKDIPTPTNSNNYETRPLLRMA